MIVLKFGGTSVGSVKAIKSVRDIVNQKLIETKQPLIVIVSALGGVTNQLADILTHTISEGNHHKRILKKIHDRHIEVIRELLTPQKQSSAIAQIKTLFNQLEDLVASIQMLQEITPKSSDLVMSFGELFSSKIIDAFLSQEIGYSNLLDPREFIICDSKTIRADVNITESKKKAKSIRLDILNICPGFIGSSSNGELVTLGRGGSDYSAALLANFYDASQLEIWTDVDGLMTADPHLVENSRVIHNLSYEEALELSHFGAKVIYPPSIQPALEKEFQF